MPTSPLKTEEKAKNKKKFVGIVVSNKSQKTILVLVERQVQDSTYKKIVTKHRKFMAHDEEEVCQEGDLVEIEESRPISKRKAFCFKRIIRKKVEVTV
jgi:small subunit ribosomal protein S17